MYFTLIYIQHLQHRIFSSPVRPSYFGYTRYVESTKMSSVFYQPLLVIEKYSFTLTYIYKNVRNVILPIE